MLSQLSDRLHAEKYRGPNETFRESMNRIASSLKDDDQHFVYLKEILNQQRFLPAGRIQAAMGSPRRVTAFNCFFAPKIEDTFTDGENSIMGVATKAATTMRMGGGIGYDFSTLRPRGEMIRTLNSASSGPVAFMSIFNAVCRVTSSAGNRRGAQMGVMRIDHPDILEFVHAKQNTDQLNGFNLSIAVTNEFMNAVRDDGEFSLVWDGKTYETITARLLWEDVMRSTWDWAEPGILFIDQINHMNNLYYCETITGTNPCGEQPLPPDAACLLGSFNLVRYVRHDRSFDYEKLVSDVSPVLRAMDNVIDRTIYPLPNQEQEAHNKRRIGIGVTGLANALEFLGYPYGSDGFLEVEATIMKTLTNALYQCSAGLSSEKGSFKKFDRDAFLNGNFISHLEPKTIDMIAKHGIRNSHLTSIAPTGTISICANNVSSSIEPVYKYKTQRIVHMRDGEEVMEMEDFGVKEFGVYGKTAEECTLAEHLKVLAVAQKYVDSACSKTINVAPSTPWEDFKNVYFDAWGQGCKGVTTFNSGGKRNSIFGEDDSCSIDIETGEKSCE